MIDAISSSTPASTPTSNFDLTTEDFINLMVTQLQNQDPLEPTKNEELLAQMSQIGQLESSTKLQESLTTMVLQNNLASAGNLIGKEVSGFTSVGDETLEVTGQVTSIRVEGDDVKLELDTGYQVDLTKVTNVS
ncbi:MAG: flagellar hook capping FlgD N-terminal domain-containing protein [Planctomycetota bacterium]